MEGILFILVIYFIMNYRFELKYDKEGKYRFIVSYDNDDEFDELVEENKQLKIENEELKRKKNITIE